MKKKALIIGHTGQDGYYLRTQLAESGYAILGISTSEIYDSELSGFQIGKVTDPDYALKLIDAYRPDELYYLAALHQSSGEKSGDDLSFYHATLEVNAHGFLNLLGAIERCGSVCKVFYASSSHVFGGSPTTEQSEETPFKPVSIYGISKVLGMSFCDLYNDKGLFSCSGIFYNHESPRRASKFVSKKIVENAVAISKGRKEPLVLGDLNARIDWGYAPDYVRAARLMLQQELPGHYIVSSGHLHTVKDFVSLVFSNLNMNWEDHVQTDGKLILKKSVTQLKGDNAKLRNQCGWSPSVSFEEMVNILVNAELTRSK